MNVPSGSGARHPGATAPTGRVLAEGRFLRFVEKDGWEYVERTVGHGVVAVLAITDEDEVILVEQHRPPVDAPVIELPAGIAGDHAHATGEDLAAAARRELLEEAGYAAAEMTPIGTWVSSAGLSGETVSFFRARGLVREHDGGGDETESIRVHLVPRAHVHAWLDERTREGRLVDVKVLAVLGPPPGAFAAESAR